MSTNTKDLLLLGALGIGAYYILSRRAVAAMPTAAQQQQAQNNSKWQAVGTGVNVLGQLFGTVSKGLFSNSFYGGGGSNNPATVAAAANAGVSDSNPDLNGSIMDWLGGNSDGMAINPVNSAPWDFMGPVLYRN